MNISKRLSVRPTTAIALVALFFALGGSAFAVGERFQSPAAAQQRCSNGAVRGIAAVTGDPSVGMANIPDRFSASRKIFRRSFNCTGRAVQVRRVAIGTYEVRFVGNTAPSALAGGFLGGDASAELVSPGTFRVAVYPAGQGDAEDRAFILVLV